MNNKLFLHECPKCRQIRLENTYLKKSVYFSTCKFCRENKGIEENYINSGIEYRAALTTKAYNSKNKNKPTHLNMLEKTAKPKKTAFVNAVMLTLCKDYNELPTTVETNHNYLNMVIQLSNLRINSFSYSELKMFVNQPFAYKVNIEDIEPFEITTVVSYSNKDKIAGFGQTLESYTSFNLKKENVNTKKKTRADFQKKKTAILKDMLETKKPLCYLCNKDLCIEEISIDHLNPISHGGTNDIENLGFTCKECNELKRSKPLSEFRPIQEKLIKANKKEQDLLAENENIQESLKDMEEQIKRLNVLMVKLQRREQKNNERLDAVKEYKELTIRMEKLENTLSI